MTTLSLLFVALLAACGQDRPAAHLDLAGDASRAALSGAIDRFVGGGRTPDAFAELAHEVAARDGLSPELAADADRELVVLALEPVQAVQGKAIADQIALLAVTVLPTLLAPAGGPSELAPERGEEPNRYLQRLCGGVLADTCFHAIPELQGQLVYALAVRRAALRAREAVARCLTCANDPGWYAAVLAWEELDRGATEWVGEVERRARPDNWPLAGGSAADDPALHEVELSPRGDVLVGGQRYEARQRVAVLRDLRGPADDLAVHLHPETAIAQLRAILADARTAGYARVALVAREPSYPWRRRVYWITDGANLGAPNDSVRAALHALDAAAIVARAN